MIGLLQLIEARIYTRHDILTEKLGNLAQLKVGKMIDILKQPLTGSQITRARGTAHQRLQPVSGNFNGITKSQSNYGRSIPEISETSKIIDVGIIKGGIGGLRKAYKAFGSAEAFALYVDGQAVCFAKCDEHTLAGSSRTFIFAYDLSIFKDKIDKEYEDKLASARDEWDKKYITRKKDSSYDKRYAGHLQSTTELKKFLEELIVYADGKSITCKLVLADTVANEKRKQRHQNRGDEPGTFNDLNTLQKRLKRYKISKKPTVDNIEDFIKIVLTGKIKVVQFAGKGYSTTAQTLDKINPLTLLNGGKFEIYYRTVNPDSYDSIDIKYRFNKEDGTLKAYKAAWHENAEQHEHGLEPEMYLKDELKVDKLEKDTILKDILIKLKSGAAVYPRIRAMITAAKNAGYDYPEFTAIEKSMNAGTREKST